MPLGTLGGSAGRFWDLSLQTCQLPDNCQLRPAAIISREGLETGV